jgi:hypothetical protein
MDRLEDGGTIMLSRRDCFRGSAAGLLLSSVLGSAESAFALGPLPLGQDSLYKQISADGKSELICYTNVDLPDFPDERTFSFTIRPNRL